MHPLGNIDFRTLQIFLTLMSERSVTRTSLVVGVSQPAITQALNKLRQVFGDPLLVRGQAGMLPTERALALEREVKRFFDGVADIQAPPEDFDPAHLQREIVITAPEYLEQLLLPHLARVLRHAAPGITLSVRAPDQRRIGGLLASGEVDFRLGWVRDPQPSVRATPLFDDEIVVIGGPRNTALDELLTLPGYMALPHVRLQGNGRTTSGRVIDEFVRQQGGELDVRIHAQGLMALLGTLMVSDVVATVPRRMALKIQETFPIRIAAFPGALPRVSNYLYWHERTQRSAVHKWFRSLIGEAAAQAAGAGAV
ncbi:MAG: LysR family transcriptional regulator [Pigmentiphaga sp.]|uniref:LysR family transcriptional regulator n=1 Tax=Pigmentiphaga sp. TaxID=1977564 RepID=UPI0029B36C5F|nr:LysR family transcriptional regulator [Pigmentiphaga sp.]MDX3905168.1 LysR family transcriptional regulator [Pigmentiphaga sp.]